MEEDEERVHGINGEVCWGVGEGEVRCREVCWGVGGGKEKCVGRGVGECTGMG